MQRSLYEGNMASLSILVTILVCFFSFSKTYLLRVNAKTTSETSIACVAGSIKNKINQKLKFT